MSWWILERKNDKASLNAWSLAPHRKKEKSSSIKCSSCEFRCKLSIWTAEILERKHSDYLELQNFKLNRQQQLYCIGCSMIDSIIIANLEKTYQARFIQFTWRAFLFTFDAYIFCSSVLNSKSFCRYLTFQQSHSFQYHSEFIKESSEGKIHFFVLISFVVFSLKESRKARLIFMNDYRLTFSPLLRQSNKNSVNFLLT